MELRDVGGGTANPLTRSARPVWSLSALWICEAAWPAAEASDVAAGTMVTVMAAGESKPLSGKVALVAGATRGAGRAVAVELARAGAAVYATGRSSRVAGPSEVGRPETIEETGDLITAAGGDGVALRVDHLQPDEVRELIQRIDRDHGRLDVLVNDIF